MLSESQGEDLPGGACQPGQEVLLGQVPQALTTLRGSQPEISRRLSACVRLCVQFACACARACECVGVCVRVHFVIPFCLGRQSL